MLTQTPQKRVVNRVFTQQQKEKKPEGGRMYAFAFDMDMESLKLNYGYPYNKTCSKIGRVLQWNGFPRQQDSVYFGNENIQAVTGVLGEIEVSKSLPWFGTSVRDIPMLRIEELNVLMPAVQQGRRA